MQVNVTHILSKVDIDSKIWSISSVGRPGRAGVAGSSSNCSDGILRAVLMVSTVGDSGGLKVNFSRGIGLGFGGSSILGSWGRYGRESST